MQLSPKPTLSLVSSQHSTADRVGTLVPWIAGGDEGSGQQPSSWGQLGFIQGKDNLELLTGTELTIRSSGAR